MEATLVRSTVVQDKIEGGMAALFLAILKMFFDDKGHHMELAGVSVKLHDGITVRVFLKLAIVISDEAALHAIFACKGSAGLKPCMLCQNVYQYKNVRDVVEKDATGVSQYHTCSDVRKLKLHTIGTIKAIVKRLRDAAATMTKTNLAELEVRLGWNYAPHSLVFQPGGLLLCDPTQCVVWDWMHVFFVSGIFNIHAGQMMWVLKEYGITYQSLGQYVACWQWPSYMGKGVGDIFCAKRAKSNWEDGTMKATASEGMSILPVLANFAQALLDNRATAQTVRDHARCFVMLADVVIIIQRCSRYHVDPDELQLAICTYLQTFKGLFGEDIMVPKFHFAIHFPGYLRRFGFVPSCFVLERKHKVPKRFANEVRNTDSAWEASVLREVTCHHLAALSSDHFGFEVGLLNAHPCSKRLLEMLRKEWPATDGHETLFATGQTARINAWERCSKGDVVLVKMPDGGFNVAEVALHVSVQVDEQPRVFLTLVNWWKKSASGSRSSKWKRDENSSSFVCTDELQCSLIWGASGTIATVLKSWLMDVE